MAVIYKAVVLPRRPPRATALLARALREREPVADHSPAGGIGACFGQSAAHSYGHQHQKTVGKSRGSSKGGPEQHV